MIKLKINDVVNIKPVFCNKPWYHNNNMTITNIYDYTCVVDYNFGIYGGYEIFLRYLELNKTELRLLKLNSL